MSMPQPYDSPIKLPWGRFNIQSISDMERVTSSTLTDNVCFYHNGLVSIVLTKLAWLILSDPHWKVSYFNALHAFSRSLSTKSRLRVFLAANLIIYVRSTHRYIFRLIFKWNGYIITGKEWMATKKVKEFALKASRAYPAFTPLRNLASIARFARLRNLCAMAFACYRASHRAFPRVKNE